MMDYPLLKLIHILAAVVVTGTGAGIAFFMLMAYLAKNLTVFYHTSKIVVLADWLFTMPAVITQLVTGLLLIKTLHYSFQSPWFYHVLGMFCFIGACWLPVIWLQYRLRDEAARLLDQGQTQYSPRLIKLMRCWIALGIPAFITIVVVFYWMVFKPQAVI